MTTLRSLTSLLLFATVASGIGCATASGGGHRDVHSSATIDGAGPRMLAAGPTLLLHVDVDGGSELSLFTVARKQGGDADCAAGPTGEPVRLRNGGSNRVNLAVASAEVVCVTPAAARASLTWHAKKVESDAAAVETLAMWKSGR